MRLQVFLSKAGISSRRAAVNIIRQARVAVNGKKILEPSFGVTPGKDEISLDGKTIRLREKVYVLLNKPKGVTTTKKDRFAEKTVMSLLPRQFQHLNPAGRLDRDTRGLILLTNDGELINALTHPRFKVEKVYAVRVDKGLEASDKVRLENGIMLDGRRTSPCSIALQGKNNLEVTLHEGRKRQIRKMFLKTGYRVVDLKRTREGFLRLGALGEGRWRFLTTEEVSMLRAKKYATSS